MKKPILFTSALLLGGLAQAAIIYTAPLSGPAEDPPNASPGTGWAKVTYDSAAHTMEVVAVFSGLQSPTTVAHIHAPTVSPFSGVASVATSVPTFTGFPAGVTAGVYVHTFDLTLASSWNPAFIAANGGTPADATAALAAALADGKAYLNIHSTQFPRGEIRGFLHVPEPGAYALVAGLGLCAFGAWRRFQRS